MAGLIKLLFSFIETLDEGNNCLQLLLVFLAEFVILICSVHDLFHLLVELIFVHKRYLSISLALFNRRPHGKEPPFGPDGLDVSIS